MTPEEEIVFLRKILAQWKDRAEAAEAKLAAANERIEHWMARKQEEVDGLVTRVGEEMIDRRAAEAKLDAVKDAVHSALTYEEAVRRVIAALSTKGEQDG